MPLPLAREAFRFLMEYGYVAFFALSLIEESGVPLPLPGDGIMLFAGYLSSIGRLSLGLAFVAMESGTLVGASILHFIGRRGGRPLLYRYGRYLHLDRPRLELIESWLSRHAFLSIVAGRLIPGLRIPTSFVSGVFLIPYRIFLPAVAIGSSLYILFFMFLGASLGREARPIARLIARHLWLTCVLLVVAAVTLLIWLYSKRHPR